MPVNVEYLRSHIREIRRIMQRLMRSVSGRPFRSLNEDERFSLRYQIIMLAETLGSPCLHIALDDLGEEPDSYSDRLQLLQSHGLAGTVKDLVGIVRLRNLLVHRYWEIDDEKVYKAIRGNFGELKKFIEQVEEKYGL